MEISGIPPEGGSRHSDPGSESRGSEGVGYFLALSVAAWAILHGPTIHRMATTILSYQENWQSLAVPFLMVAVYWRQKHQFGLSLDPFTPRRKVLLVTAVILYAGGWILGPLFLLEAAMVTHMVWIISSILDKTTIERFWPLLAFIYFIIPPPLYVSTHLFAPLKKLFAIATANFLMWLDVPLILEETRISFPAFDFMVVDECSGIRSLTTLVIFAIPLATFSASSTSRRILLIALALPLAIIINFGRIVTTALVGLSFGSGYTTGPAHTAIGLFWLMLGFGVIALFAVALPYEMIRSVNTWFKVRPPFLKGYQKSARLALVALAAGAIFSFLGAIFPYFRSPGVAENYYRETVMAFSRADQHPKVIMASYKYLRNSMNPDMEFLETFTSSMIEINRVREALEELKKYSYRKDLENLNLLLASLHFMLGQHDESLEFLEPPSSGKNADPYLFLKVKNLMILGRHDEADAILDRLVRRNPGNFIYPLIKAENLYKSGADPAEIETFLLDRMGKVRVFFPIHLALGELAMIRYMPAKALGHFEDCYRNSRGKARHMAVTGACLAALSLKDYDVLREWTGRLREFENSGPTADFLEALADNMTKFNGKVGAVIENALASAKSLDSKEIRVLQAAIFISNGKIGLAESILKSIFSDSPDYGPATRMEFELHLARGDHGQTRKILKELQDAGWPEDDLAICRARAAMATRDYPGVLEILRDDPSSDEWKIQATLLRSAARAFMGQDKEARAAVTELLFNNDGLASGLDLYRSGMILHKCGDLTGAEDLYRRSVTADPSNFRAMNNLAWVILDKGGPASEALIYSALAFKVAPADHDVIDTHGWMLFKSGDLAGARAVYSLLKGVEVPEEITERARLAGMSSQ